MLPVIISALASLIAGLLLGGCANGNSKTVESLMVRNANLQTQLTANQAVQTGLAGTLVLLGAALAVCLWRLHQLRRKGGSATREKTQT